MESFYAINRSRKGPVSEPELAGLLRDRIIARSTLVWHARMPGWKPYSAASGMPSCQTRFVYARFWIRFLAWLIDGFIVGALQALLPLPMGVSLFDRWGSGGSPHSPSASAASSSSGRSTAPRPEKRCSSWKVVTLRRGPISPGQAIGRYFGQILSGTILGIGFIVVAFDDRKRALHDRPGDTRVIRIG
jgi:hypothetical protein